MKLKYLALAVPFITALAGCGGGKQQDQFAGVSFKTNTADLQKQGFKCSNEMVQGSAIIDCKSTAAPTYVFGYNSVSVEALFTAENQPPTTIIVQLPAEAASTAKKPALFKQIESTYGDHKPTLMDLPDGEMRQWTLQGGAALRYMSMSGLAGPEETRVILSLVVPAR